MAGWLSARFDAVAAAVGRRRRVRSLLDRAYYRSNHSLFAIRLCAQISVAFASATKCERAPFDCANAS